MTAGNSLCFIIAFRILEISIILKLNEEKNISPPFYRFLKYFVFIIYSLNINSYKFSHNNKDTQQNKSL